MQHNSSCTAVVRLKLHGSMLFTVHTCAFSGLVQIAGCNCCMIVEIANIHPMSCGSTGCVQYRSWQKHVGLRTICDKLTCFGFHDGIVYV